MAVLAGQWSYVCAAYAATAVLSGAVAAVSYAKMRRAEAKANALRQERD